MIKKRKALKEAVEEFLGEIKHRTKREKIEVLNSCNRVLLEDVKAKITMPPFDRAAMDGYAVKAEDTFGVDESNPSLLRVVGEVETGEETKVRVERVEAVRISTGAMMHEGANAVVMVEYTNERDGYVEIYRSVAQGEDVVFAGSDIMAGELLATAGSILTASEAGLLAAT